MKQCGNCGKEAKGSEKFCLECGTKLVAQGSLQDDGQPLISEEPSTNAFSRKTNPKKEQGSLGRKIMIGSLIAVLVLLLGGYFMIQSQLDPMKKLMNLDKYYSLDDVKNFTQSFRFPADTIVEENAFFNYVKEEDWEDQIYPELEKQLKKTIKNGYSTPLTNKEGYKFITIKEDKFLFFFKKYSFDVHPVEVSIHTNKYKATFNIDSLVSTDISEETQQIGSFAPGIYSYNLTLKDDYFENVINDQLLLTNTNNGVHEISIDLSPYEIQLTSDIPEAIIYINEKSTEKTAKEIELFAAKLDDSVKVHAVSNVNGGSEERSEVITLNSTKHHIQFPSVKAMKESEAKKKAQQAATKAFLNEYEDVARSLFYDFRESYQYALGEADFGYVQNHFVEGSKVRKDYSKFVTDHNNLDYYYYNFQSNMIDSVSATDPSTIILDSTEIFEFYLVDDGTWSYQREKRYTMKLSDQTLKIADIQDRSKVIKKKISD